MKASKAALRIVLVALLLAAAWYGYGLYKKSKIKPLAFNTVAAEVGELRAAVSASGTLSPLVSVNVGAQVSGRIMELFADYNSEVEVGQLLAKIDPSVYEAAVQQNEARSASSAAQYREAQANATLKRKQVERIRELAARELIAPADLDTAEAELSVAEARVSAARASQQEARAALAQARSNLDFTDIYSPVSGVVLSREVDVGQSVSANFETPTLFQIAENLRTMQVNSSVAEADIGQLRRGMKARFTVDAWPDRYFEGVIREIRLLPEEVSNVVTYDAVVDVPNNDRALLPGMTATIDFILEERASALMIPNAALRFQPPESLHCEHSIAPTHGRAGGSRASTSARTKDAAKPVDDTAEAPTDIDASKGSATAGTSTEDGDALPADKATSQATAPPKPPVRSIERIIWVQREGGPTCLPVELGITDGSRTEVLSGDIEAGDAVITGVQSGEGSGSSRPRGMRVL